MKTKIINAHILTMCDENFEIPSGCVCIDDKKIVKVCAQSECDFVADKVIDFQGDVLMPGFVNAHAHNAMVIFRGVCDDADLQDWLYDNIFPLEANLCYDDVYWGTKFACMQSVQSGITTVLDEYFVPDAIIKATREVGMRAFVSTGVKIDDGGDRLKFLYDNKQKYGEMFDDLIKEYAYCHGVYTFTDKQIEDTIRYAKEQKLVSTIHASENLAEVGGCAKEHNDMSPIEYLESLGYFDQPALIAHGVCVDKDDIAILQQYDVSVATNPASNLKIGSGIAPINSFLTRGVNVCIGTDGCASNNALDFFRDMYLTATLQKGVLNDPKVVPAKEVLKMATINGAKALQLDDVGLVKENYQADLIRISTKTFAMNPVNNLVSNIVYSASKSDVVMTMVAGKIVYENGKWTNVDEPTKVIEHCQKCIDDLKERARKSGQYQK